jgi:hypothetical protein
MHDPIAYITPDCMLDVSAVTFRQVEKDRVALSGARGKPRTPTYKVVVGYFDGYIGSGEMGIAGINALARARLGIEVVKERLRRRGLSIDEMCIDLIGMNSLHGNDANKCPGPYEVRLRIAARMPDKRAAEAVGTGVRSVHTQGPSGAGGGINFGARQILAVKSVLIPRDWVKPEIIMERAAWASASMTWAMPVPATRAIPPTSPSPRIMTRAGRCCSADSRPNGCCAFLPPYARPGAPLRIAATAGAKLCH